MVAACLPAEMVAVSIRLLDAAPGATLHPLAFRIYSWPQSCAQHSHLDLLRNLNDFDAMSCETILASAASLYKTSERIVLDVSGDDIFWWNRSRESVHVAVLYFCF